MTDDLSVISQKIKDVFSSNQIPIQYSRRIKSIHGSHDDIIEINVNTSKNIQVLPDDANPGKYLMIGIRYLVENNEVPKRVWKEFLDLGLNLRT